MSRKGMRPEHSTAQHYLHKRYIDQVEDRTVYIYLSLAHAVLLHVHLLSLFSRGKAVAQYILAHLAVILGYC